MTPLDSRSHNYGLYTMEPPRFRKLPQDGTMSLVSDPIPTFPENLQDLSVSESSHFDKWTPVTSNDKEKFTQPLIVISNEKICFFLVRNIY